MNQLMEVCPDMYTHVIDICNLADREKYVKTTLVIKFIVMFKQRGTNAIERVKENG